MASTIITKHSTTAGATPTADDLVQGELAVNTEDRRVYTKNDAGEIVFTGERTYTHGDRLYRLIGRIIQTVAVDGLFGITRLCIDLILVQLTGNLADI